MKTKQIIITIMIVDLLLTFLGHMTIIEVDPFRYTTYYIWYWVGSIAFGLWISWMFYDTTKSK